MTTLAPVPTRLRLSLSGILLAIVGGILSAGLVGVLGPTMGLTLGYFWGTTLVVAILTLALCPLTSRLDDLLVMFLIWAMLAMQWLITGPSVGYAGVVRSAALVLAMQWSIVGLMRIARWMGLPTFLARGVSALLLVVAITSPIWLGPILRNHPSGFLVDVLANVQVLLVINAQFPQMGYWTHDPIAYTYLTNLGQDVAYAPARTVAWSLLVHGLTGAAGFALRGRSHGPLP